MREVDYAAILKRDSQGQREYGTVVYRYVECANREAKSFLVDPIARPDDLNSVAYGSLARRTGNLPVLVFFYRVVPGQIFVRAMPLMTYRSVRTPPTIRSETTSSLH